MPPVLVGGPATRTVVRRVWRNRLGSAVSVAVALTLASVATRRPDTVIYFLVVYPIIILLVFRWRGGREARGGAAYLRLPAAVVATIPGTLVTPESDAQETQRLQGSDRADGGGDGAQA